MKVIYEKAIEQKNNLKLNIYFKDDWSNIREHILASVFQGTPCTKTSSSAVLIHCHGLRNLAMDQTRPAWTR